MDYEVGDKVRIVLEGTVDELDSHDGCLKIEDSETYKHYVYPGRYAAVTIEVIQPEFKDGLYQDSDGEMILRLNGDWHSFDKENSRAVHAGLLKRLKTVTGLPFGNPW